MNLRHINIVPLNNIRKENCININYSNGTEKNLGKYLQLSKKEDIFITRNGKIVAKLSNPNQDKVKIAKSLLCAI